MYVVSLICFFAITILKRKFISSFNCALLYGVLTTIHYILPFDNLIYALIVYVYYAIEVIPHLRKTPI